MSESIDIVMKHVYITPMKQMHTHEQYNVVVDIQTSFTIVARSYNSTFGNIILFCFVTIILL